MDSWPGRRGLRMPAEWEPHAATWLAWPHRASDWPGRFDAIPRVYTEVIRHLVQGERVELMVPDAAAARTARKHLAENHVATRRVRFHLVPTDRSWTRDTVPAFVTGPRRAELVHWRFNGWAKYGTHRKDARVGEAVAGITGLPRFQPRHARRRVVLEGGAYDVDGRGLLLTTEECLLSRVQARNPGITRRGMEVILAAALGVEKVLWLGRGIAGDDTHGHVDDIARFVAPGHVVALQALPRSDANHASTRDNLARLRRMRDAAGRRLQVSTLPMPQARRIRGVRLPASYANFYIANGRVLVPVFNDPADCVALRELAGLFPLHQVVGLYAGDLVWGLGTLHCMTAQQPR